MGKGGGGLLETERRERAGFREMWADTAEAHTSWWLTSASVG